MEEWGNTLCLLFWKPKSLQFNVFRNKKHSETILCEEVTQMAVQRLWGRWGKPSACFFIVFLKLLGLLVHFLPRYCRPLTESSLQRFFGRNFAEDSEAVNILGAQLMTQIVKVNVILCCMLFNAYKYWQCISFFNIVCWYLKSRTWIYVSQIQHFKNCIIYPFGMSLSSYNLI